MIARVVVLLSLLVAAAAPAAAQQPQRANVTTTCGSASYTAGTYADVTQDTTGKLCTSATGGSGGTSSSFGAAFPATGTAAGFIGSTGNMAGGNLDSGGRLIVNCGTGCAGAAGDGTATGALNALNAAVSIAMSTYTGSEVNFTSGGTLSGTVVAEGSNDGGTSWPYQVWFLNPSTGALSTSLSSPSSGDYSFAWVGSISQIRVRVSAFTSGTTTANLRTTATNTMSVMVGSDGTNLRVIALTTGGLVKVDLSGTAANATAIKVDGSAVTQPVSGTVAATESGTWTVQPGNTANTTPWLATINQGGNSATVTGANALKVDGSAVTQPVSGTVTANIGTSGSLALDASVTGLEVAQGSTTSGQKGALVQGAVTTAAPSYTTGQTDPLSLTTAGALRVDGSAVTQPVSGTVSVTALPTGSNTIGKVDILGNSGAIMDAAGQNAASPANELLTGCQFNTTPTTITSGNMSPVQCDAGGKMLVNPGTVTVTGNLTGNQAVNVAQFGGTNVVTGTGAGGAGIPRVTVSNDSTVTANAGTGTFTVAGGLTNNNAAPGATNVGTLPCVSTAAAPSYTEGNQVACSTDLSGGLRTSGGGGGLSVTDSAAWTAGSSSFTPTGGEYNPKAAPLASGQQGTVALTANRAMQSNLQNSAGQEMGATNVGAFSPPLVVALAPAFPVAAPNPLLRRSAPGLPTFGTGTPVGTPINTIQAAGAVSSTGAMPFVRCDRSAAINTAASGFTQLVALVGAQSIYVCGYTFVSTSALSVKFSYGTGSACGTGTVDLTGAMAVAANGGVVQPVEPIPVFELPGGQALCINLSGATQVSGHIKYAQF